MWRSRVNRFLAAGVLLICLVSLGGQIGLRDLDSPHRVSSAAPLIPVGATDALQPSAYTFDVTSSGEAVWDMPIWAPAGRNGLAPSLSFSYRSRRQPGLMGQGFSVNGLSAIARCWRTVAQDGRMQAGPTPGVPDAFCLDGQRLVPRGSTAGELQPEMDPSILVRVNGPLDAPLSFDVFHSNGQIWRYGAREICSSSSHSQLKAMPLVDSTKTDSNGLFTTDDFSETVAANERVITWNVDRVEDRWGNYYVIDYLLGCSWNGATSGSAPSSRAGIAPS
jgi:hypothetical protein